MKDELKELIDNNNKYVERLSKEWEIHGKLLIAVDYDDTFSPGNLETNESIDKLKIVNLLKTCIGLGAYIVCFTSSAEDRYPEIKARFKEYGVQLDGINTNVISLKYGNNRKIYYNILLDDRSGLTQSMDILATAAMNQRIYLLKNKLNNTEKGEEYAKV